MPMKTFKKVVESPRLVIRHDEFAESPREWSNLGTFLTKEGRYQSPDGTEHPFYSIMVRTADEAGSTEEHIALMKKEIEEELDEKIYAIYPVNRYEHGRVAYRLGEGAGFDVSNCGFYFITESNMKDAGIKEENIDYILRNELEVYTQYANGDVYGFVLYDEDGNMDDACGGFYDIEDIREHLPKEFRGEDLEAYLTF